MQEDWARLIRNGGDSARQPGRIVYSAGDIAGAVNSVARRLADITDGQAPTFLILLKGGARFGCELIRAWPGESSYDFIGVSSYGERLASSGRVEFYHYSPDRQLIDSRTVVMVDDICDSGTTFAGVAGRLKSDFAPRVLLSCSLIWRSGAGFTPDLFGFRYDGEEFLVGYGLGAGERYRHLNDIRVIES